MSVVKKYKPRSPGRRFMTSSGFGELTHGKPERSLIKPLARKAGRNVYGRITSRHRGGGNKRKYRVIDFKRNKYDILAKVASIEYDPNRSARIALLHYRDGEKRYILAPEGLAVGDTVVASTRAVDIRPGNALPLRNIPTGTFVHNLELDPGRGAKIVRSAGAAAQILTKEGKYAHVRLPSGEIRLVHLNCIATIGQVSNIEHSTLSHGKAGKSRWLGRRPYVRGAAMNPVDHPHGGGEGKASRGRDPVSPWGWRTKGQKTRHKKKRSNKLIIKPRGK